MHIRLANIDDVEHIAENNTLLARESEGLIISHETTLAGVKAVLTDEKKAFT